ncbi:MAG TPA: cation:proton antiporter, partial [Baekduia sp.]|nr:cation:proton antiporter [Baekduia sp.]
MLSPPPLAASGDALVLLEFGTVLLGLGVLARLAAWMRLSPIPFYLLAGVALGTVGDGPLPFSGEVVEVGADIGLVLLLFTLGLEYAPHELSAGLRT